ncbi:MerR family transcriptional regulator [Clostridium sardiniense]|uniref:MerR family transcriptional regulator n=1 Tax=Clostridium sardiniense TaxID=29369 RepID=UPI003D3528F8
MKLSIGETSKIFNISKDTLRYYDKIGILKPQVNPKNGYRYYLLRDLEKLGLIVGIKYLGISLSDIKSTIESEDIHSYKNLVVRQEDIIKKRLNELVQLKENLANSKIIMDKIINFNNEYDFTKIDVKNKNYILYSINMKSLLCSNSCENINLKFEKEVANLSEESYFYIYNILENKDVEENDDMFFVKENSNILKLVEKYSKENIIDSKRKIISGKFVCVDFYGTIREIHNYILLLNKHFKCSANNIAYVKYEFYLPRKNEDIIYFVNINLAI